MCFAECASVKLELEKIIGVALAAAEGSVLQCPDTENNGEGCGEPWLFSWFTAIA